MSMDDLQSRFPEMKPIQTAPSLNTLNGIGMALYGQRDYDAETQTYVATHYFCIFFIPIFAVGAYRVANAPAGWYFIGKVPLSGLAKSWNLLFTASVLLISAGFYWHHHTHTPEYLAKTKIAQAEQQIAEGKLQDAARNLQEVASGATTHAPEALKKFTQLLDSVDGKSLPAEAAGVFACALEMQGQLGGEKGIREKGLKVADAMLESDPRGALSVLDAAIPPYVRYMPATAKRQKILEGIVAKSPDDLDAVSQLALVYESQGNRQLCVKLLLPSRDKLGASEGARILGQILAQQGELNDSHTLLSAYTASKLPEFQKTHAAYQMSLKSVEQNAINSLNSGAAVGFDFDLYRQADKKKKIEMANQFLDNALNRSQEIRNAREKIRRGGPIVPAALDLGIVQLRRGQTLKDASARVQELKQAEKTFLSIREMAGERDEFKLLLGQVYYWLGKHDEGKRVFDELLVANAGNTHLFLSVSKILREVGLRNEARDLAEDAYKKAANDRDRFEAAAMRSVMNTSIDDKLVWLERSDPTSYEIQSGLHSVRGHKAMLAGNTKEAATHFRNAIAIQEKRPESATIFNNTAISYLELYEATGNSADFQKSVELLEKAILLSPSDSILIMNSADTLTQAAIRDIAAKKIDLSAVKMRGKLDMVGYLYDDEASFQKVQQAFRDHPGIKRAIAFYERLVVLSPKGYNVQRTLVDLYEILDDTEKLKSTRDRLDKAKADNAEMLGMLIDYQRGTDDKKFQDAFATEAVRCEKVLDSARKIGATTHAVAVDQLATARMSLATFNVPQDVDGIVDLTREAHKIAPSYATLHLLKSALLYRATADLAKSNQSFGAAWKKYRRSLSPNHMICLALENEDLRPNILTNSDVKEVYALLAEQRKRMPKRADPWHWAMMRFVDPQVADQLAQLVRDDEDDLLSVQIDRRLSPSPATAINGYWLNLIDGKSVKDWQAYAAHLTKQGLVVPTPPLIQ